MEEKREECHAKSDQSEVLFSSCSTITHVVAGLCVLQDHPGFKGFKLAMIRQTHRQWSSTH